MNIGRIALGLLAGVAAGALWRRYNTRNTRSGSEANTGNATQRYVGAIGSTNQGEETSKSYSTQLEGAGSAGPKARVPYTHSKNNLNSALG